MTVNSFPKEYFNQVLWNRYMQLIHSHLDAICEARHYLGDEQELLEVQERLRPMECDDIISDLSAFLNAVRNFEELLNDSKKLPQGMAPQRYNIFVVLNYTEQNIKQVMSLLSAFRTVCLESSQETYEMLNEIRHKIDKLLQLSEGLESEANEMLSKMLTEGFAVIPN